MRISSWFFAVIATSFLAGTFLAGCAAGPAIRIDRDLATDLEQYRTFGFYDRLETDKPRYSTITTTRLKEATTRELEKLGYRHDEENPDLMVNFSADVSNRQDVTKTPASVRGVYGFRPAAYRAWTGYAYDVDVRQYEAGTLIIDLVDARRKQLVWRGIAEGELGKKERKDPAATVERAVSAIFGRFPGEQTEG
jgi:hypothetical protein